jgi:hypothetical protein
MSKKLPKKTARRMELLEIDEQYGYRPGTTTAAQDEVINEIWKWAKKDSKSSGEPCCKRPRCAANAKAARQKDYAKQTAETVGRWQEAQLGAMKAIHDELKKLVRKP